MARIYYSQQSQDGIQEKRLLEALSSLDDHHAVFITPRGSQPEDFVVFRPDGIHYIRQVKAAIAVKTGPRIGPWFLEDGSKFPNPYTGIGQAANALAGALRESVAQIVDDPETNASRVQEFISDLKVFPILVFFAPKPETPAIEKPGWGAFFPTIGGVERYFARPMKWQHNLSAVSLKLSKMEVERIARLLGYVHRSADIQTATSSQLRRAPDPYEFAKEVGGAHFFGRATELTELQDFIRSGKHVAVFGLQRVGKTSLIKEAFSRAYPTEALRPLFVEVNLHRLSVQPDAPAEFLLDFIEAVVFSATNAIQAAAVPLGTLQNETTQYLTSNRRPQQLAIALHKFLDGLRSHVGKRICIFVDELQVLGEASKSADSTRLYQSFIRALGDTAKDAPIQFFFSGRLSVLRFNEVLDWQLLKLCKKLEIGFLDSSSAKELVIKPSKSFLEWDATAVEELIRLTGGHPYFLQYICSALVSFANNKNANRILREDVITVATEIVRSKVEQNTIRLLYSDFESSGTLVHDLLERIATASTSWVAELDVIPPAIRGKDQEKFAMLLLQELCRANLLDLRADASQREYSLKVGLIKKYFESAGVLPVGPEALESASNVIDRLEHQLCVMVIQTLKAKYGTDESGWWKQGVPLKIRQRIGAQREEDPERLGYEAYFYTIEYKEIIEAQWEPLFKPIFGIDPQKRASDNLDWIRKINEIRKSAMHATRSKARGGVKPEEMDYLRGRLNWLAALHAKWQSSTSSPGAQ